MRGSWCRSAPPRRSRRRWARSLPTRPAAARGSALVRRYDWPAIAAAIVGVYETVVGEPVLAED